MKGAVNEKGFEILFNFVNEDSLAKIRMISPHVSKLRAKCIQTGRSII